MKQLPRPEPAPLQSQPRSAQNLPTRPRFTVPSRKQWGYLGGAIAIGGLIFWGLRPAPLQVSLGQVEQGPLQVSIRAEGKTRVRDRFTIAAPVDGRLDRIQLTEGDRVDRGMIVARLDPLPLHTSVQKTLSQLAEWRAERDGVATQRPKAASLEQLTTRIRQAEADRRQAEAKVAQAEAAYEQARRDRDRADQLAATGALPQQARETAALNATTQAKALESARLAAQAAAAAVEVAQADLQVKQAEQRDPDYLLRVYDARIAAAEADLTKLQADAQRTEIRSPSSGRVLRILQKSAQFVAEGTPLLEVADINRLELVIDVLSSDAEQIRVGQTILIDRPNGSPLRGRVSRIEPAAFTKVSALGVEEQRVNVIGEFLEAPQGLGEAYRLDTQIITWESPQVVKVPLNAIFRCDRDRSWCLFTIQQGRAHRKSIVIGHRSPLEVEVYQGIAVGQPIILHPTEQLQDGSRILAQNESRQTSLTN